MGVLVGGGVFLVIILASGGEWAGATCARRDVGRVPRLEGRAAVDARRSRRGRGPGRGADRERGARQKRSDPVWSLPLHSRWDGRPLLGRKWCCDGTAASSHVAGNGTTAPELTVVRRHSRHCRRHRCPEPLDVSANGLPRAGAEDGRRFEWGSTAIRMNTTVCVINDGSRAVPRGDLRRCRVGWACGNRRRGPHSAGEPPGGERRPQPCFNYLGAGSATPAPCAANGTLTVTSPSWGQPYRWSWPPLAA